MPKLYIIDRIQHILTSYKIFHQISADLTSLVAEIFKICQIGQLIFLQYINVHNTSTWIWQFSRFVKFILIESTISYKWYVKLINCWHFFDIFHIWNLQNFIIHKINQDNWKIFFIKWQFFVITSVINFWCFLNIFHIFTIFEGIYLFKMRKILLFIEFANFFKKVKGVSDSSNFFYDDMFNILKIALFIGLTKKS